MLFHAIAQGQIHSRRARMLLNVLRVANSSCRRASTPPVDPGEFVRHVDQTADGTSIAADPSQPPAPLPEASANEDFAANPSENSNLQDHVAEVTPNQEFGIFSPFIEPASTHAIEASS
jgi:hypothetical protein